MKKKATLKNVIVIGILVFLGYRFITQEITLKRIEKEILEKQQELEGLQEQNLILEQNLKNSDSDEYLEKLARERLNMIKSGEQVVNTTNTQETKEAEGE